MKLSKIILGSILMVSPFIGLIILALIINPVPVINIIFGFVLLLISILLMIYGAKILIDYLSDN